MSRSTRPHYKPARRKDVQRRGRSRNFLFLALAGIGVLAVVVGAFFAVPRVLAPEKEQQAPEGVLKEEKIEETRVSFVAVGDNLPDGDIGYYADACAGSVGDGVYDYSSLYAPIKPYIEAADLAYIKQETHIGGDDIGPRGWPSFNTTDAMADAVVSTGFDMVASATNHSYDWGTYGAVDHSCEVWSQKPVVFVGTAASEEQAQAIHTIECNGIVFSLLDYTYGVNGFERSDLPSYAVSYIDEDAIRADVERAKQQSDVVLVAMHWGTENQTTPDDMQQYYAHLLADLEVDVVLGSHPHVIGPLAWVEGASGHKTLVAYSLGNFISNHAYPEPLNELEGMLSCDFVHNEQGISIENIVWTPLVNHTTADSYGVYAVRDYTPELAQQHRCLSQLDDPLSWLKTTSAEVVEGFTLNMEQTQNETAKKSS